MRGTIYPHRADIGQLGIFKYGKYNLIPITSDLYINEGSRMWWAWDVAQITKLGNAILKQCKTKSGVAKHVNKLIALLSKAIESADIFKQGDLTKLSDKELAGQYQLLYKDNLETHGILNEDVDAFDVVFDNFLQTELRRYVNLAGDKFISVYKDLSTPCHTSYLQQQNYDTAKLYLNSKGQSETVDILHNEYWWTSMGWESMKPHSKGYFMHQVKTMNRVLATRIINDYKKQAALVAKQRRRLLRQYKLPRQFSRWLWVLDKYAYLHDCRKEMQVKTMYAYHLILLETAKRLKIKESDLEWLFHNEVAGLLKGKRLNKKLIADRKISVTSQVTSKKIIINEGNKAHRIKIKSLNLDRKNITLVKGLAVTAGLVHGRALVCQGAKEAISKVKQGDILICPMTLPDYLPAMKMAKAIVTDEGGLTCHAAIIARELGKVCIVGTKEATRVFKTGDLVEVDANRGVIRKL